MINTICYQYNVSTKFYTYDGYLIIHIPIVPLYFNDISHDIPINYR
jgi:hypothetical protein